MGWGWVLIASVPDLCILFTSHFRFVTQVFLSLSLFYLSNFRLFVVWFYACCDIVVHFVYFNNFVLAVIFVFK